jgi:hypothetical protein
VLGAVVLGRAGSLFFPKLSTGMEFGSPTVVRNPHLSGTEMVGNHFESALFETGCCLLSAVFVISLPIEFLQMELDSRSPDVFDIMRNMAGAFFAVVFFSPSRMKTNHGILRIFQIGVVAALILFAVPLTVAITDEIIAVEQFPVLGDFETPFETIR